jgi:hypothetical protein
MDYFILQSAGGMFHHDLNKRSLFLVWKMITQKYRSGTTILININTRKSNQNYVIFSQTV